MRKIHRLEISWSTSRGRETYGYNICRLDDSISGKRYRCSGGGYDMIGTVFANWFEDQYPDRLRQLVQNEALEPYGMTGWKQCPKYYGLTVRENGAVSLDGACGVESIRRIVEACGFEVQWSGDRKGRTKAYYVQEKEGA